MKPTILDCMGLPCPQPVLRTKDALEQGATLIEVHVDNEASQNNVARFGRSQGHTVSLSKQSESLFVITITAGEKKGDVSFNAADYACPLTPASRVIYVISSDTMGRGDDILGRSLLHTFIQTIKDVQPQPSKIVFFNSGVKLVTEESDTLEALKKLQANGVEILACGTCLSFYELKSAIKIGMISNMLEIMTTMAEADKIISPL